MLVGPARADADRVVDAALTLPGDQFDNRIGAHGELRDNAHAEAGASAAALSLSVSACSSASVGNARVPIRVTRNTDFLDAEPLQHAAFDGGERVVQAALGLFAVAGDYQRAGDARFADQLRR